MDQRGPAVVRHMETMLEISALINSSLDIGEVRERSIGAVMELLDARAASMMLRDPDTGELCIEVPVGEKSDEVRTLKVPRGQGVAGWVAEEDQPAVVPDVRQDRRFYSLIDEQSGFVTTSLICVPLTSRGRVIGVLEALNKREGCFGAEDLNALLILSNQVAVALENARLYQESAEMFGAVIQALLETIEKRDEYTSGHTRRVTGYSVAIGRHLGLTRTDIEDLRLAAMLHDIGKIGVSDKVLHKNGGLTADEVASVRHHAVYGAEILRHIRKLSSVVPGVRHHHEHYNGAGYPEGLRGADIPVFARVIAVADTFDAMVTDRPYRKGLTTEQALDELRRERGNQFDPAVVSAFLDAFRRSAGCGDGAFPVALPPREGPETMLHRGNSHKGRNCHGENLSAGERTAR